MSATEPTPSATSTPHDEGAPPRGPHALSDRLFRLLPAGVRARWPTIRAVLIAYHVIAVVLLGFPAPAGVMNKGAWKEPSVQNEMKIWSQRANAVGFSWTQEEFEQLLWDFSQGFLSVRGIVLKPFKPYADYLGTRQDWRMFSAPHRYPSRVEIDVRIDKQWVPVWASRSSELTWHNRIFDHHRIRRLNFLHAWKKYRRRYKTFTKYVARQAAVEFPEADRVRIRFYKFRTPTPEERRAGKVTLEGKYINRREHELDDFRPGGKEYLDPSGKAPEPSDDDGRDRAPKKGQSGRQGNKASAGRRAPDKASLQRRPMGAPVAADAGSPGGPR